MITWFAAANLPIVAGIAAASVGLHVAILAAGASIIGIRPRAALYGGVSVCLLASAVLPSGKLAGSARAVRPATSAAAMGLVFMGAIVLPVYLVPAPHRGAHPRARRRNPPGPGPDWPMPSLGCDVAAVERGVSLPDPIDMPGHLALRCW